MDVTLRAIDLTRELGETSLLWPGNTPLVAEPGETLERDGSFTRRVSVDEHSGTHFDAPSHFAAGGWHVADVPVDRLVRPLHVVQLHHRGDPNAVLTTADIELYEGDHGIIPGGSAVFVRTDWRTEPGDDVLAFPGFGVDAARMLVENRDVVGLGIDTLGIDPGRADDFPVHREVTLPRGVWHVENVTGLDQVPPAGAWVVVGVPRVSGASGFPARVVALVPHLRDRESG
jgi:kynurenine formamidase